MTGAGSNWPPGRHDNGIVAKCWARILAMRRWYTPRRSDIARSPMNPLGDPTDAGRRSGMGAVTPAIDNSEPGLVRTVAARGVTPQRRRTLTASAPAFP